MWVPLLPLSLCEGEGGGEGESPDCSTGVHRLPKGLRTVSLPPATPSDEPTAPDPLTLALSPKWDEGSLTLVPY